MWFLFPELLNKRTRGSGYTYAIVPRNSDATLVLKEAYLYVGELATKSIVERRAELVNNRSGSLADEPQKSQRGFGRRFAH